MFSFIKKMKDKKQAEQSALLDALGMDEMRFARFMSSVEAKDFDSMKQLGEAYLAIGNTGKATSIGADMYVVDQGEALPFLKKAFRASWEQDGEVDEEEFEEEFQHWMSEVF